MNNNIKEQSIRTMQDYSLDVNCEYCGIKTFCKACRKLEDMNLCEKMFLKGKELKEELSNE